MSKDKKKHEQERSNKDKNLRKKEGESQDKFRKEQTEKKHNPDRS